MKPVPVNGIGFSCCTAPGQSTGRGISHRLAALTTESFGLHLRLGQGYYYVARSEEKFHNASK